jgi:hypothetical protein
MKAVLPEWAGLREGGVRLQDRTKIRERMSSAYINEPMMPPTGKTLKPGETNGRKGSQNQ